MRLIGSTLPVQNLHLLQPRRSSFKSEMSPLNPSKSISSTESTRQHIANLDKLLQTRAQPDTQPLQKGSNSGPSSKRGKGLLESLNLAHIWPKIMAAADEMSPRHLRRLQRLLSKTPEYSPRNNLGYRWREYHGLNDWAGLLDPLDENLRREVVRYGEFVQAAYHGFHSDPAMSAHDPPPSRQVALPDKSYKVTKNLYATSSIGLPDWVDDVAPDLGWMTQRSSWIGYVAVCDDDREIRRMGRRDVVIALRGTATCLEWAENVRAQLVNISGPNDQTREQPKVECGFLSLYKTRGVQVPSLAQSVVEEIRRLRKLYSGEPLSITVTGHSLGAALALLVAEEISKITSDDQPDPPPQVAVFSFGGPRVGNKEFANQIESKKVKVLRIVNNQDVITKVPLPAAYAHVGTELRVDTKMSPFLKPNADVACCHDLEAYLHLVDGFMASNCPFRTNAKRSLVRLMKDQGGNLKKLYTSKGRALSLSNVRREIGRDGGLVSLSGYLPSPHPE